MPRIVKMKMIVKKQVLKSQTKEAIKQDRKIRKSILEKYSFCTSFNKKFIEIRSDRDCFYYVEKEVPKKGVIIDLGCGHGYFSNYLYKKSNKRKIIGIDNDFRKIPLARKSVAPGEKISFIVGDITKSKIPLADAVVMMDVLYQLPNKEKELLIKKIYDSLKKGGTLIFKDTTEVGKIKLLKARLREMLVISVLRRKPSFRLYYVNYDYWVNLVKKFKFKNISIKQKDRTPMIIITAKK